METWKAIWDAYRGRIICAGGGLIFAVLSLCIGFFPTLFIALCAAIGWILGAKLDGRDTVVHALIRGIRNKYGRN